MGRDLTPDDHVAAQRLLVKLKNERAVGKTTPKTPLEGWRIAQAYNQKFGTQFTDVDVRSWVHWLRAECHEPVGSDADGYWYCVTQAEWEETKFRLMARIKNQIKAATGPDSRFFAQDEIRFATWGTDTIEKYGDVENVPEKQEA
jgi:hypothetical protein